MKRIKNLSLIFAICLGGILTACAIVQNNLDTVTLDYEADIALQSLHDQWPSAKKLTNSAAGILLVPKISEASFVFGAAYGQGVLKKKSNIIDYYSFVSGSWGLNAGIQQYSHALFFMTEESLLQFKKSNGFNLGADFTYAMQTDAHTVGVDYKSSTKPIIAVIFGQNGLMGGFNFEGVKYSKINP